MSFFVNSSSSRRARSTSCALRRSDFSGESTNVFTTCCVMVEPPCTNPPAATFLTNARTIPA